jgi:hypothetical protein
MVNALRTASAALLALTPALISGHQAPGDGWRLATPLRATLRPAPPAAAPAWLEQTVCDRGAELGQMCDDVARAVDSEAQAAGVDPVLMLAIIEVESAWDNGAVSDRAAHGLMQLQLPTLADEAADGNLASINAHDPLVNVRAGIRYYARLQERFQDPELALIAYNAGPNRLAAYLAAEGGVPERFWEYPQRVQRAERRLRARLSAKPAVVAAVEGEVAGQ